MPVQPNDPGAARGTPRAERPANPRSAAGPHGVAAEAAADAEVDAIVGAGPTGTFAVAGVATAIVVAIYFAFYLWVYLPRGAVQ